MAMNEYTCASTTGPRFSFNEMMNIVSGKIQNLLVIKGCISVKTLIKLVHEDDDIVYQALRRLADEGKITSEMKRKTEYITLVDKK